MWTINNDLRPATGKNLNWRSNIPLLSKEGDSQDKVMGEVSLLYG